MSKFVSLSGKPGMNALNTDFTRPGAGLEQAGVTLQNIHDKWAALYEDRGNKGGGSKQLWGNLTRWTTANGAKFAARYPEQAALFNKSVETGQLQAGLKPETLMAAMDWGIRENDRSQQHKSNFLDSTWGKLLGKALQIGVAFIPGVGQIAAMGIGAALGAAQAAAQTRTDGWDIAMGGATGAMAAAGGEALQGSITTAGGVGPWAGGIADKAGNFVQHPIQSFTDAGRSALGMGPSAAQAGQAAAGFSPNVPAATGDLWNAGGAGFSAAANWAPVASAGTSIADAVVRAGRDALPFIAAAGAAGAAGGGPPSTIANDAGAQERERQRIAAEGSNAVDTAFGDQTDFYKQLRKDIYGNQVRDLNKQYGDQSRELLFELSRRGHLGGSPELDATSEMSKLRSKAVLEAGSLADGAVRNAQGNDLSLKAQAKRDIIGGVNSTQAVGNALSQSRLQAQQASDAAKGQNVGDLLMGSTYLYNQRRQAKDVANAGAAYQAYRGGGSGVGAATTGGGSIKGV
jgi:hypothetical protein